MPRNAATSLWRAFRFFLITALAVALSMGIAYGVTRYLTAGTSALQRPDSETVAQAKTLHAAASDLSALIRRYRVRKARGGPDAAWMRNTYFPTLERVQHELNESSPDGGYANLLLQARDSMEAMARFPDDSALQRRAFKEVQEAANAVADYLRSLGLRAVLADPHVEK